jgi:hypothetical protein
MSSSTEDETRKTLAAWGRRRKADNAARDAMVTDALANGISREEIHILTGLGRTTIDRIIGKTRIEVDYNERDEQGRVIAGVSSDQLLALHEGQAVNLYDRVDRLQAGATVAWIEADARAVGFDVNWTSFADKTVAER